MPLRTISVSRGWGATPFVTATAETAVAVANTSNKVIRYAITSDDTAPTPSPVYGLPIAAADAVGITLSTGERLWIAAPFAAEDTTTIGLQE